MTYNMTYNVSRFTHWELAICPAHIVHLTISQNVTSIVTFIYRYKCGNKSDLKLVHCKTKLEGGNIFQTWSLKKMCFFLELLSIVVIVFAYKRNSFVTKYQKHLQLFNTNEQVISFRLQQNILFMYVFCSCIFKHK